MLVRGGTHIGQGRQNNEDCYLIINNSEQIKLFAVADGMGGYKGGEVASSLAVQVVKEFYREHRKELSEVSTVNLNRFISEMFYTANKKIWEEALRNTELTGMGTTLTVAIVVVNQLIIGHIGDSRAYLINSRGVQRLTEDHSYVQKLVNENQIEVGEENNHPQRNLLTRALGTDKEVEVDIYFYSLVEEDYILLCTDGLTRTVSDAEMKDMVMSIKLPSELVDRLIKLANARGGPDNITLIVIRLAPSSSNV
ncbi:MAG: serine/threonine protein phosphatase [Firmicutes bacterium HGW-Firmicutes-13]|nr:MAG: serine/threonine protein phosphatase [Firmicutes bacterium HGW-Firmicutes-13]